VSLAILHREPTSEVDDRRPVWRTCLREVVFLDGVTPGSSVGAPEGDGQQLVDGHAYRLLLEILCGLQSPMTGETQVLGQFKTFLATLGSDQPALAKLGQRLLTDARDVRATHLQGLGSRSYGSAVRRDLAGCEQAIVIGTGKLAHEVLPFLADEGRLVDMWGRASLPYADAPAAIRYFRLDGDMTGSASVLTAALVVAAPVSADLVELVAARYPRLIRVIDLRADLGRRPLNLGGVDIVTLQDLFARMHDAHASAVPHIDAARQEIARRARQYELRDELRPFGWDDLCA
jgi:glutamyl-tRNA reductase